MENLTPETLTLIITAIMLINAVILVAFLIQKIRAKRYRNIALKWADKTVKLAHTHYAHRGKYSLNKQINEMMAEYNQDFEFSSTEALAKVENTKQP